MKKKKKRGFKGIPVKKPPKKSFFDGLSKNFLIVFICVCVFFIVVLACGIVIFSHRDAEVIEDNKLGGRVKLNYSSSLKSLTILNATPVVDSVGTKGTYTFDFSVETDLKDASKIEYEISLSKDLDVSTIDDRDIRIYLEKEDRGTYNKFFGPVQFKPLDKDSSLGSKKGDMVIAEVKKIKSGVDNYRLRMWLSDTSAFTTGDYSVEVNINGVAK